MLSEPLPEFNQHSAVIPLDSKNTKPVQGQEIRGICNHMFLLV